MEKKQLILQVIKYLESRANATDNGWEWREVCGLSLSLREAFSITDEEFKSIMDELYDRVIKDTKILNPCDEIFLNDFKELVPMDSWTF